MQTDQFSYKFYVSGTRNQFSALIRRKNKVDRQYEREVSTKGTRGRIAWEGNMKYDVM